jgi:uncharacterized protein (UPF0332 family)
MSRLRRAFSSLQSARALLAQEEPCTDDAVSRAAAAALHAVRALVESQWARDSQPGWDPLFRPGMSRPYGPHRGEARSIEALQRLLERFDTLAANLRLPPDFNQYLRTLVEDGQEADIGEAPEYEMDEAEDAVETALRLVATVAGQIGLSGEFQARFASFAVTDPVIPIDPAVLAARARATSPEGGKP